MGSIPKLWRSSGERNGNPLQYSFQGNPTDRGDWQATVVESQRIRHDLVTKLPPPGNLIVSMRKWRVLENRFLKKNNDVFGSCFMSILYEKILKLLTSRITSDYIDITVIISILWPPDAKSQLTGKHPDAGKDRRQEEKGTTEDEMVGWHHWLNGHEFEQAPEDGEGQGSLAYCSPWGRKESDMTERLNNNKYWFRNCPLCVSRDIAQDFTP